MLRSVWVRVAGIKSQSTLVILGVETEQLLKHITVKISRGLFRREYTALGNKYKNRVLFQVGTHASVILLSLVNFLT